jgi:hypothetical protein
MIQYKVSIIIEFRGTKCWYVIWFTDFHFGIQNMHIVCAKKFLRTRSDLI